MNILLIYKSKTGFTKRYAEWISQEIDCKVVDISNIENIDFKYYDLIVYGSRIYAGKVDGLDKIRKLDLKNKLIIFATGATPKETTEIQNMWKNNLSETEQKNIKHFYIPAGLNYEKMEILDKIMMKIACFVLSNKKDKSKEEIGMQNSIRKSYDISNKSRIIPIVNYIRSLEL